MRNFRSLPLMMMVGWTVRQSDASTPDCALRCWENTKYITLCAGDHACLCSDSNYQNSVFQCIYSQCNTVHFASGVHHAIAQCHGTNNEIFFAAPPIPNRDELRRREEEYAAGAKLYGSGGPAGYPTESAGFPIQSANYPTDSAGDPASSPTASLPFPYFPLNTLTSPAVTPATPTLTSYNALPISTATAAPQVYTGEATSATSFLPLVILFSVTAFYLAM